MTNHPKVASGSLQIERLLFLLPALVALLAYLPALGNQFVWDDHDLLVNQPYLRDPTLWTDALRRLLAIISPNYFRPLAVFTFLIEARLWRLDPTFFHLTNIALHALNTLLVTLLARTLWQPPEQTDKLSHCLTVPLSHCLTVSLSHCPTVPLSLGLIYALHPALVESVSFTSSRFDLLQTTLLLLALLADVRLRAHTIARPAVVGVAFFAALLAKESAVVFPLVYLFWRLAFAEDTKSHLSLRGAVFATKQSPNVASEIASPSSLAMTVGTWLALGIASVGYLVLRYAALGYIFVPQTASTIPAGAWPQRVLLIARVFVEYALVVAFPFTTLAPLHYTQLPIPHDDAAAWISLALSLALLGGLIWLMRRARRPAALVAAGISALGLALNVVPLELSGGTFIAERYLTFPLALFTLALGSALSLREHIPLRGMFKNRNARGKCSAGSLPATGEPPVLQPPSFWVAFFAKQSPIRDLESVLPGLLAMTLCQVALVAWLIACAVTVELTIPHWRDGLRLWTFAAARAPRSSLPHVNLSNYYLDQNDDVRVLQEADAALRLDPNAAMAWNNRGVALFKAGQYAPAQAAWERAMQIEPGNALFWNNLANALRVQGRLPEAERMLLDALRLNPNLGLAHFSLGVLYLDANRPDLAIAPLENAVRLLPPNRQESARASLAQARARIANSR